MVHKHIKRVTSLGLVAVPLLVSQIVSNARAFPRWTTALITASKLCRGWPYAFSVRWHTGFLKSTPAKLLLPTRRSVHAPYTLYTASPARAASPAYRTPRIPPHSSAPLPIQSRPFRR